ncbi:MAG TPA: alanine racemase [Steroidobacteraceae bacterium]|nr:alanine racemase [Steroidobacteraceae bacterium]
MIRLIRARIDTHALRSNLAVIRAAAPRSRVLAVIKANAYGHGLVPVALALSTVDAFAVARIEEAGALRTAGITQPIVLLEGILNAGQLAEAAHLQLELVIHDPMHIALLEQYRGSQRLALWLKVDTGMNRLGVRPSQFQESWDRLQALEPAPLALRVLTHLACADERGSPVTAEQLARLAPLVRGRGAEVSIANSAAILAHPATHADWVRPGLALYGVSPFAGEIGRSLGLVPAMTLESTIIAVRTVERGDCVGYGATWRAARPSRIAILAGGYGDGLLRSLPNGAPVLLKGGRAPLAGRVSMDMIAVDVTELPLVAPGERAELWGGGLPVEEVAEAAGTIPYELLCGVNQRVSIELV